MIKKLLLFLLILPLYMRAQDKISYKVYYDDHLDKMV